MVIPAGTVVYFQGEKFRVVRSNHRDVIIQNVEGYRMTVSPISVEVSNEE